MNLERALVAGMETLALVSPADAVRRLLQYLLLIEKWNRVHNLTAVREPERMLTHHLLDSLAVLAHLPDEADLRLLDVGSGAGLPGIPIAIMRPAWRVTLLDSNGKKASFLRQAVAELELANAQVVQERVEEFSPAQCYDVAISRAYSDLADFVAGARRLVCTRGVMAAMKGVYPEEEIAALPKEIAASLASIPLAVPGLEGARHLILLKPGS